LSWERYEFLQPSQPYCPPSEPAKSYLQNHLCCRTQCIIPVFHGSGSTWFAFLQPASYQLIPTIPRGTPMVLPLFPVLPLSDVQFKISVIGHRSAGSLPLYPILSNSSSNVLPASLCVCIPTPFPISCPRKLRSRKKKQHL